MIRQMFASMNEMLDELMIRYPIADSEEKIALNRQWDMLKALSDDMIEAWLLLEDKMGVFRKQMQNGGNGEPEAADSAALIAESEPNGPYVKGNGYFKLQMFVQAAQQLEQAAVRHPEAIDARLLLAMCRMHLQMWGEAQRHFQFVACVSDNSKYQAIAYNALGCIQAVFAHLEEARRYFCKALEADPAFCDPRTNLEACAPGRTQVRLQFGSAELQTLIRV